MTLEAKILSDGCGNLAILRKPRKPIVNAIRDFPPNCGPAAKRLPFQARENAKLQRSVDDLKSTNTTEQFGVELETKNELLPTFSQDASVNAGLLDPLKTEVLENTRIPDEVEQIATNTLPPRRRIPAKRDFPPGCGRNAAPIFTVLETSGLDENIAEGEETTESGHENNVSSTNGGEDMYQSRSISSSMEEEEEEEEEMQVNDNNKCLDGDLSEHTISSGKKEEEEEMQVNDDNKCVDGELSEHITQKKDLTSSELPGRLIIVQGLMAASNCPWTNNSRRKFC